MVSRCKIISRSSNELYSSHQNMSPYDLHDEEDVWFNQDKLYQDHILEILQKWDAIDDEIWAKIIVMERNKRIAKAYVRAPAISINGSDVGFDGYTIGINGFDSSPPSDAKVLQVKKMIGKGVKIKMDQMGNILIKRLSRCNVFIKTNNHHHNYHHLNTSSSSSSSTSTKSTPTPSSICVPIEKAIKLFDMKSFASNIDAELMNSYPDRKRLEAQCITIINFVQDTPSSAVLDAPCYLLLINIVAIDMLKSKLPSSASLSSPSISSSRLISKQTTALINNSASLSSNSSSGSSSQQQQQLQQQQKNQQKRGEAKDGRKSLKFTSFDPKVTYSSSSGTSSADPYAIDNTNNNDNYNNNIKKSSHSLGNKSSSSAVTSRRHHRSSDCDLDLKDKDPVPTPDYDDEEIEQVYGQRNATTQGSRYQKNANLSSINSASKPSFLSRSTGKLLSINQQKMAKSGAKSVHPLKEATNRERGQDYYHFNPHNKFGAKEASFKMLSKSQSASHLHCSSNSYQSTSKTSSSNGFSLSDSSDPYTSIKTSLDSEEIYPITTFKGQFSHQHPFDYHPFGINNQILSPSSSSRMTESFSSFTDDDVIYGRSKMRSKDIKDLNFDKRPLAFKYARNWK